MSLWSWKNNYNMQSIEQIPLVLVPDHLVKNFLPQLAQLGFFIVLAGLSFTGIHPPSNNSKEN